jgi:hypothetical protein
MSAAILVFAIGATEIRAELTRFRGICGPADFDSRADFRESGLRVRLAVATKVAEAVCP